MTDTHNLNSEYELQLFLIKKIIIINSYVIGFGFAKQKVNKLNLINYDLAILKVSRVRCIQFTSNFFDSLCYFKSWVYHQNAFGSYTLVSLQDSYNISCLQQKTLDLTKSIKISFELLLLILQPPSLDVIILVRGNIIKPQIQVMVMLLQRKVTHDDGEKRRRCDFKVFD